MTNQEIKTQIDANNKLIQQLMDPTKFTLDKVVSNLIHENMLLQAKCTHEFQDGVCKFCYKKEIK